MKTYMFIVNVQSEIHPNVSVTYYTNAILSKNDGALVKFTDHHDVVHDVDPLRVTIEMNVDEITHCAKPPII